MVQRIALVLYLSSLFLSGCENEDIKSSVLFTGTVRYQSTNTGVPDVPLELILIDNDTPFDRGNPGKNIVRRDSIRTNERGVYFLSIPVKELPKNASYFILLKADNLFFLDKEVIFPCLAGGVIFDKLDRSKEINDIQVDHPTFVQVFFDKIDHLSTNRLEFSFCLDVYETTLENPDLRVTKKLPFIHFKKVNLYYTIISESGERTGNWLMDIPLNQNDTTKVLVEY